MELSSDQKLKYPILFVHGMGFRDNDILNYWGRIPKALEENGCAIFYGYQDSNASAETNGKTIAERIDEITKETGALKVNIIAHSKGGLDSRYAISTLHAGSKVASLTTISTPHNGSETVDRLMKLPQPFIRFIGFCADCFCRLIGDKKPNSYHTFHSFTTKAAAQFNAKNPNDTQVYYQSYAFIMKHPFSDILLWFPSLIVGLIEGKNDGLLTPKAVRWGDFKGIYSGVGNRGISHLDEIDLRRRPLSKRVGDGVSDIPDVYINIVKDLFERGF